jgi:hypothetical protein
MNVYTYIQDRRVLSMYKNGLVYGERFKNYRNPAYGGTQRIAKGAEKNTIANPFRS